MPRKARLIYRIANALAALRGRTGCHDHSNLSIHVDLDTAEFEEHLERLRGRVGELVELANQAVLPEPRLMIKASHPLTPDRVAQLRESVQYAAASGKTMVVDDGLKVFQLIDGRWQSLDDPAMWLGVDPAEAGADRSVEIRSGTLTFGESPLKQAREAIGLGLAAEQYTADLLASKAPEDHELPPDASSPQGS